MRLIKHTNDFGLEGDAILTTFRYSVSTWENPEVGANYEIIGEGTLTADIISRRWLDGINMVHSRNLPRGVIAMNIIWTDRTYLVE